VSKDLVSKKTRNEFREHFTHWYTVREIEREFDAADIYAAEDFQPTGSSVRRNQVDLHLHRVDFTKPAEARKVLKVYEAVLTKLELEATTHARSLRDGLLKWLRLDGYEVKDGKLMATPTAGIVHLADIEAAASQRDVPELRQQIDRLRAAVDADPSLAIGTAKEMIETVCKEILTDLGVAFADDADIPALIKSVRTQLRLLPTDVPKEAKGSETIRTLLGNLGHVAQGLGELRNLYGSGHGRSGKAKGLTARHARLAVGTATTLAMFLLETHAERKETDKN
jgi:Abortive infection C-terminus